MQTIAWTTALPANAYRIAILELADKHGPHDVLSMILRGMNIDELKENIEYLNIEFTDWVIHSTH